MPEDRSPSRWRAAPIPSRSSSPIEEMLDAGFDHVYLHQIGADQEGFCHFWRQGGAGAAAVAAGEARRRRWRLRRRTYHDHRAGATTGVSLARHLAEANADTEWGGPLADLHHEIAADRDALDDVLSRLRVRANPVKQALAPVAARLQRLKLNRHIFTYSPLSRVPRARTAGCRRRDEAQPLAITGGERPARRRPRWRPAGAADSRATTQHEELLELHRSAARVAFGTGSH